MTHCWSSGFLKPFTQLPVTSSGTMKLTFAWSKDQTTLIPWVQSIVIKHYVLGKEVFFQGQDNYIGLYRYLDDFVAL
jgi:hypothetical protein